MCQSSSKGYICRKSDGTGPTPDAGTPAPVPPDGGAPTPDITPGTDTTAPTVTIASPSPKAQIAASVTVKATAKDNVGVTKVEFLVDNVLMASKTSPPFDFPTILQAGSHTLTVSAYDKAKNTGQASVSVSVGGAPAPQSDSGGAPSPQSDGGMVPPQSGGDQPFGNTCTQSKDCLAGLCAFDPVLNEKYCTQQCGVQDWCPPGGVCVGSGSQNKLCALQLKSNPEGTDTAGGCSLGAGAGAAGSLGLVLLGLLALVARRRRG